MITLNMLGQPCPIPVVEAKKALSQSGAQGVIVLVDNIIAMQNLEKMAAGLGYGFFFFLKGENEYAVTILAKAACCQPEPDVQPEPAASTGVVFLITGDQIGISGEEPGKKLMKTFLYSLAQLPAAPEVVLLLNAGVKMASEGSEVLDEMKALAGRGTDIRSCGQCLNYYGLTEKLAVGTITNMLEIVTILTSAKRAITL
jgi:selenium metabolism protein YedF